MDNRRGQNEGLARKLAADDLEKAKTDDAFVRRNFDLMKQKLAAGRYPAHEMAVAQQVLKRGKELGLE